MYENKRKKSSIKKLNWDFEREGGREGGRERERERQGGRGGRETGMEGGRGRERGEKIAQKHTHCNGLDVIPTAGYKNCYSRVHTVQDQ